MFLLQKGSKPHSLLIYLTAVNESEVLDACFHYRLFSSALALAHENHSSHLEVASETLGLKHTMEMQGAALRARDKQIIPVLG